MSRKASHPCVLFVLAAVVGACSVLTLPAGAADWTVGSNVLTCDFTDLQLAIDASADGDRLLLERFLVFPRVEIVDKSLEILGGHVGCGGAPSSSLTYISGQDFGSAVRIEASKRKTVVLVNLQLEDGKFEAGAFPSTGSGVEIVGAADVEIESSRFWYNQGLFAGGVWMTPAHGHRPSLRATDVDFLNNQSLGRGGALHCSGGSVEMRGGYVYANRAEAEGGGLAFDDCDARLVAEVGRLKIDLNRGDDGGGGIWAAGGSLVELDPDGAQSVAFDITRNQAFVLAGERGGGGVLVEGGASFVASAVNIADNQTNGDGGGIAVHGGTASIGETMDACGKVQGCNFLTDNWTTGFGGAIYVEQGTATLEAVNARGNVAHPLAGGFANLGLDGGLLLASVAIHGHEGNHLIEAEKDSVLLIESSTLFENDIDLSVVQLSNVQTAWISQSILHENGAPYVAGDAVSFTCNFVDGFFPLPPGAIHGGAGDPDFVAAGDFHVEPGSPVIDLCDQTTPHSGIDLNYQQRTDKWPDAGADER